jgi:hypothetical protein
LHTLALSALANTIYGPAEIQRLIAQRTELAKSDELAYAEMDAAAPRDGLTWENRVQQFGEQKAGEMLAGWNTKIDARKATLAAYQGFNKQHPLIAALLAAQSTITAR